MSSSSPLSSSPPADLADAAVFDFADNPQCAVGQEHMNMCVCHPWSHRDAFAFVSFTAGGTGGADETGANKNTHQPPVIQLETSNCVPAIFQFSAWREAKPRT